MTGAVVAGGAAGLRRGALDPSYSQGSRPQKTGPDPQAALLERFPPRRLPKRWAWTDQTAEQVLARLSAPPFLTGRSLLTRIVAAVFASSSPGSPGRRARPGRSDGHEVAPIRWATAAWRALPAAWLASTGAGPADPDHVSLLLGRAMLALVSGDVIRPSLGWLSSPGTPRGLARRALPQP